jgi:hypothetical protein
LHWLLTVYITYQNYNNTYLWSASSSVAVAVVSASLGSQIGPAQGVALGATYGLDPPEYPLMINRLE